MQYYLILMCSFKSAFKAQSPLKISKISFMLFSYLLIFIKTDKHRSINTATSWLLYNYNDKTLACIIEKLRELSVFFKLLVDCIFIQFKSAKKITSILGQVFLSKSRRGFLISHCFVAQSGHDKSETKPVRRISEPQTKLKKLCCTFSRMIKHRAFVF